MGSEKEPSFSCISAEANRAIKKPFQLYWRIYCELIIFFSSDCKISFNLQSVYVFCSVFFRRFYNCQRFMIDNVSLPLAPVNCRQFSPRSCFSLSLSVVNEYISACLLVIKILTSIQYNLSEIIRQGPEKTAELEIFLLIIVCTVIKRRWSTQQCRL